jgi:benzoyl-CoA reductase/2-hydroxyglutaryl-CoA dehydratase subunit BcrC/BadD/HgdB
MQEENIQSFSCVREMRLESDYSNSDLENFKAHIEAMLEMMEK